MIGKSAWLHVNWRAVLRLLQIGRIPMLFQFLMKALVISIVEPLKPFMLAYRHSIDRALFFYGHVVIHIITNFNTF